MSMPIQQAIDQLRRRRNHIRKRIEARRDGVIYDPDYDLMENAALLIAIESLKVERDRYLYGRKVMLDEVIEVLSEKSVVSAQWLKSYYALKKDIAS